jgi:inorganic pyrophosphatase
MATQNTTLLAFLMITACAHPSEVPRQNTVGHSGTMTLIDEYTLVGRQDLLALAPIDKRGVMRAIIEIPAGTLAKWEVDKTAPNAIRWEERDNAPRVVAYLAYPANYGVIPGTFLPTDLGGDGDPLDVIILGDAIARGEIIGVRLIGVLRMTDNGQQDDKLIAVLIDGSPFSSIHSMSELDQKFVGASSIIETWFRNYKGPGGEIDTQGFEGPEAAFALVELATEY